ncbi:MAG TPA: c-type cytochrome [Usitatibacter sp.]|nr:c-type cytochrome [Usitatibacter sp.]
MRAAWWSIAALAVLTVVAALIGFVWLPYAHADFRAKGLWDAICRAAGVPREWGGGVAAARPVRSTSVVLEPGMAQGGSEAAIGRGATLALQCTMCHGAQGLSQSNAPNLAGQYPDVIMKQLVDYQRGDRAHALMQALASKLTENDVRDLAAYFSYLPKPRNVPVTDMSTVPALVRVGDPLRNVAPCASCHGGIDRKLGAPWLEGMPKDYLVAQLQAFAAGKRTNDSHAQMRNMARSMSPREIEEVADFYARHGQ